MEEDRKAFKKAFGREVVVVLDRVEE